VITVTVDAADLYSVQTTLNATNAQIDRASVRSVNKTLSWVKSQGGRLLAREHDLPIKTLRGRLRIGKASAGSTHGSAWFGTRPIKAVYAGAPMKSTGGAKVRGHFFPGSFIARMPTGHLGIFKRRGATRLHIDEQMIYLRQAQAVLDGIAQRAPERLRTIYAQELNYELNVRGVG
jgi:hypothetical protein